MSVSAVVSPIADERAQQRVQLSPAFAKILLTQGIGALRARGLTLKCTKRVYRGMVLEVLLTDEKGETLAKVAEAVLTEGVEMTLFDLNEAFNVRLG